MIKSMTGFGRGEFADEQRHITCEIRSVNHRYADITIKMPKRYSFAEDPVRQLVKQTVKRGKIGVGFSIETFTDADVAIRLNEDLAGAYLEKLKELRDAYHLSGDISAEYLASLPDVLKAVPESQSEEQVIAAFLTAAEEALAAHGAMREAEGAKLAEDLLARGDLILAKTAAISERAPELIREYTEKLKARIGELLEGTADIPEERLLTEAAIFADKSNITEELVRLKSHVEQMKDILRSERAEGKRLDFLVQEMNREANTIGSKANDLTTTALMLDIKSEVEKIREQVQNIE